MIIPAQTQTKTAQRSWGAQRGSCVLKWHSPAHFQNPSMPKHPKKPSVPAAGWTWVLGSAAAPQGAGKGLTGSVGVGTTQGAGGEHVGPHKDHVGYVNIMQHIAQICQAPAAAGPGLEEEGKGVVRWESEVPVTSLHDAAALTHRVGGKDERKT